MNNSLAELIEEYRYSHELLEACQMAIQQAYPELLLRWSRIYGSRWAYLSGNSAETASLHPVRFILSPEYGICVDNAGILSPDELEEIVRILKGCFTHAKAQP